MLFESTVINRIAIPNRFVRSATWEGMAGEDGAATPELTDLYLGLINGDVGLIITGHAYVSKEGQASPRQLAIHKDDLIDNHKEMTSKVHDIGGNIVVQLAHAGCHAHSQITGMDPIGPSMIEGRKGRLCRKLDLDEIHALIQTFAEGAIRAKKAGYDGVQIHAAHGYLLSQFLSPFYNNRNDKYGGKVKNRGRILFEIIEEIKVKTGQDFTVMVKMNSEDFLDPGLTVSEMLTIARMLEYAGTDIIELSGGTIHSPAKYSSIRKGVTKKKINEPYYKEAARQYKDKITTPLMLVGGIRSFEVAEHLVDEGFTDYVSMSRPLICEPDLITRWQTGLTHKSECQNDNMCFTPPMRGRGLFCANKARKN